MSKKAIQFGAGNIGRGFLGQLFFESGYETTFVDVVDEVIEALNQRHAYPLRIVGEEMETRNVGNASALHAGNQEAVAQAIAEADIGATAVGVGVLPRIAPALAAGIAKRFEDPGAPPLNFIMCENLIGAGPYMREQVRQHLDAELHSALDEKIGFVEASIGRMVPIMTEAQKREDPLLVCVEPYCELPVDAAGFKGTIPELKNMKPMRKFDAYVERKLFVHNMTHATAAYLGYLRGHEYIWQTVEDKAIVAEVREAAKETCEGLHRKHRLDLGELHEHAEDLLKRYRNKALGDQVARIGKDPVRKLGPNDRLIGSCHMCLEQGIEPVHVARGAAAALYFDAPGDPTAPRVQDLMANGGAKSVLQKICGLEGEDAVTRLILDQLQWLRDAGWV